MLDETVRSTAETSALKAPPLIIKIKSIFVSKLETLSCSHTSYRIFYPRIALLKGLDLKCVSHNSGIKVRQKALEK